MMDDMRAQLRTSAMPAWVLAPLRLFLGVTFVYAGIQKLTDPQFFKRSAPGYIGKQILVFAHGTPLHGFLVHVAEPHAVAFGLIVALGEIAVGLGTLAGLFLRLAACFGALLSLIFFLSASWRVFPYFYGADIVFLFGWITLILADPAACGWPALDVYAIPALRSRLPRNWIARFDRVSALLFGVGQEAEVAPVPVAPSATTARPTRSTAGTAARAGGRRTPVRSRGGPTRRTTSRREFLRGAATGGGGVLILVWLWSIVHHGNAPTPTSTTGVGGIATSTAGTDSTASATGASGSTIAQVSQVATNDSASFTIPSNGDPGVLVHLTNGQFVAFDATCTHAGCPVNYDPSSKLLLCPCHGAAFDPAQSAAVVQGPADTPLAPVAIHVDNATGAITLA